MQSPWYRCDCLLLFGLVIGSGIGSLLLADEPAAMLAGKLRNTVPTTISPEWARIFAGYPDPSQVPDRPGPSDIEGWSKLHAEMEAAREESVTRLEKSFQGTITRRERDGVPVLEIVPANCQDDGKQLIYTHGGAYTLFTARSTLNTSLLIASATNRRVIAVDYTNPPRAQWLQVTDQVVSVFKSLLKEGRQMRDCAIIGESAGGGLAAGSVLKMRDSGMPMPSAVILWSPWADITETGDTYITLKDAEPAYLYAKLLGPSAAAYADPKDQKHPYVSPVYADFTRGFPPTLIQGGTRELFLSNFVRLYQALDTAGQHVKLDLYEGMPHVFQNKLPDSPESQAALGKVNSFLKIHLSN